jgi:flagellum-specific peptidoglycan hydrolase FlgJ
MTIPPQNIIDAAKAAQAKWHVPASVSIAQWAIESGWGAHCPQNNPFGIKAIAGHGVQTLETTEVIRGVARRCEQRFCAFDSLAQAFECHAKLIAASSYYTGAMQALPNLNAFIDLMAAHYATDPLYAHKVKAVIAGSNLTQYD